MRTKDFHFNLPDELIAQYPLEHRTDSRLLVYSRASQTYTHSHVHHLSNYLRPGDLLVFNDTRVIPARLYGHKSSGGRVELLLERVLNTHEFLAHIRASKAPKAGGIINVTPDFQIEVCEKIADLYHCRTSISVDALLNACGHIPLPLYITREGESLDQSRYQTVYAKHNGSVAAPTAGLHFTEDLMSQLQEKGIRLAHVTLHIGAGTFRPVRCDAIADHTMHSETLSISEALCDAVKTTRAEKGRVIAVGTTALRALESAAIHGELQPCCRETSIFITPGYRFQICDGLMTNFHLPESTLLMLVSAWIGHPQAMALYQEAIEKRYRFFSYGDASLLL